jgi:hypothetical protein
MGPTALLTLKKGVLRNFFFRLKNPTVSAGFEPANLATNLGYLLLEVLDFYLIFRM